MIDHHEDGLLGRPSGLDRKTVFEEAAFPPQAVVRSIGKLMDDFPFSEGLLKSVILSDVPGFGLLQPDGDAYQPFFHLQSESFRTLQER